ncbi:MAG: cell surface protein [Nevskia sp.]|nr:cell surface protein [Nevskia sp.]
MIPRIIHQSWKTADVPPQWQALQQSWKALHPEYSYRFWTDDDNRNFVRHHHPDLISLYDGYAQGIHRAELSRYLILAHFGGVYADMDFEALKPIGPLLAGHELLFGLEPDSHAARAPVRERGLSRIVCNAFMASVPGHPFWSHLLVRLAQVRHEKNVLDATGPFLLTRACADWPSPITCLPAELLYPLDNQQIRQCGAEALRAAAGDAYAIHHWSGSWWREAILSRARDRISAAARPGG